MALRRELLLTIGALVVSNLVLAFGAIGLFTRMSPAIEGILRENGYSIVAAENIVAEFADSGAAPLTIDARSRVTLALEDAKRNVTESEERPVLARLERSLSDAADGDAAERRNVVAAAMKLIAINRLAMENVDREAQRLGDGGAWGAVFIGFLSFLLGALLVVRLQRRFVDPLLDVFEVLQGTRDGDRFRRCRAADAPHEVVRLAESVNRLLDERLHSGARRNQDSV